MSSPTPLPSGLRPQFLQTVLIIAAGLWIFSPAFHGGWLMDDDLYLTRNPLLHDPARLWKIWFSPGNFIEYYPIEETVQFVQWQLWGNQTFGYHLTNVVLHIVDALLVWRLLAKFGLRLAWLGGLLFVIHPALVESVAWISELKNTLSLLPFLLSMCAWIDYEEAKRPNDYFLALGLFGTAMLCKIGMAPFPIVILLYAWWKRGRIGWDDLKAALPFLVLSLMLTATSVLAGNWFLQLHHTPPDTVLIGGFFQRLALAGVTFAFYFSHCFRPAGLMPIYPQWALDPGSLASYLPLPVLVAGTCWFWSKREGWGRHALLGIGFFSLMVGPFLGFTWISYMRFTPVMDHFLYIPIIGLIGLTVAALGRIGDQLAASVRHFGIAVITVMMSLLAWESHAYATRFINQEKLWTYTLQGNPDSDVAHNNLGLVFLNSGRLPEAIDQYQAALRINPDYAYARNGLGNALILNGHVPEAIGQYREALRIDPGYLEAHNGLANALLESGHLPEAKAECEMALKLNPNYTDAHCTLGLILAQQGQIPEAIEEFETARRLDPADARIEKALESLRALQKDAAEKK